VVLSPERSGGRRRSACLRSAALALAAAFVLAGCGNENGPEAAPPPPPPPLPEPERPKYGGPQNFVANPSFEDDVRQWRTLADTSLVRTPQASKAGYSAGEVRALAPTPYGIYVPGAVGYPVTGDVYEASAWIRASPGAVGKPVVMQLTESGGPTKPRVVDEARMRMTSSWKRLSVAGRVRGRTRTALDLLVAGNREIAVGDAFYVDAVTLY
jgi:hypothetical protein